MEAWKDITNDKAVLNSISGYKIPFTQLPVQDPTSYPKIFLPNSDLTFIKSEITRLVNSQAIRRCEPSKGQFVSSIFLVPKSNGEKRLILNLKKLNKFVNISHFKMEDIRTAIKLMTKNSYMVNLDLKEAYFLVPIHKNHTKYLRFFFEGTLYEFLVLPFGLSSAPHAFTKIMKPVTAYLRSQGYKSVFYLDDSCYFGNNYEDCMKNLNATIKCLTNLGFVINYKKSNLVPSKTCQFLGFILNSTNMTLELPLKKKNDILLRTNEMLSIVELPVRSFARYLGTLTAACPAVAYGWGHTKSLERARYLALLHNENYDQTMQIPSDIHDDLLWWKKSILCTVNPIRPNNFYLEIFSDASLIGWGSACEGERIGGSWNCDERHHHINNLELLAAFFGLKSFAKKCYNCHILLRIDNTTAITYINRMGGVKYPHLNEIARKIWLWCEDRKIFLFASYIKSSENTDADFESRNIDIEWELHSNAFRDIVEKYGKPEIDLFASRINAKCKKYISWKRDPYAFNVDAFTIKWDNMFFYAFPPFSLILKALQKVISDRATGIFVVPNWPSQPWFPVYKSLVVNENMFIIPPNKYLLSSNFREIHPLHRRLSLVASILSGKLSPGNKSLHQQ